MTVGAELWDVLDEQGEPTGEVVRRGAPGWPSGRFHLVVATCVVRADGRVLLTQRAATKEFPLAWELPGGSALAGEPSPRAAARELREETGLEVALADLGLAGRFTEASAFVDLYVAAVRDPGGPELRLDPGEVHAAEWVTLGTVEARLAAGRLAEPWTARLGALWPEVRRRACASMRP
ncbi:NUDIX hydrolase [Promicromonospora sp. Marseille-Q5078]